MNISKKKILLALLGIALVSVAGYTALSNMWTSAKIVMHCAPATSVSLALFEGMDCAALNGTTTHNWDGVTQGQTYEWSLFVKNTGSMGLYITYLPTDVWFNESQTHFIIMCKVVKFGLPCQLNDENFTLPEKVAANPVNGFLLPPNKMCKIDVELFVESTVSNSVYEWDFFIYGATA